MRKNNLFAKTEVLLIYADMRANTDETCHIENGVIEKTEGDYWDTKKGRRQLKMRQFMALQTKRFHHTSRNPKALFCEVTLIKSFVHVVSTILFFPDHSAGCVRLPRLCVHHDHARAARGAAARASPLDVH